MNPSVERTVEPVYYVRHIEIKRNADEITLEWFICFTCYYQGKVTVINNSAQMTTPIKLYRLTRTFYKYYFGDIAVVCVKETRYRDRWRQGKLLHIFAIKLN